jgi:hypothetical protein
MKTEQLFNNKKQASKMKTKQFAVPQDQITAFCEIIEEHELENSIVGTNEDDEIVIDVNYEDDERSAVMELIELIEVDDDNDDEN